MFKKFYNKDNNLDEMQENKLLKIESRGCWIAFWGLFLVLSGQALAGAELKTYTGEWVVFMVLAVYLASACQKEGIWDRHLNANTGTNFVISAFASVLVSAVFAAKSFISYHSLAGSAAVFVLMFVILFVAIFGTLTLMKIDRDKKLKKEALEMDEEETEE